MLSCKSSRRLAQRARGDIQKGLGRRPQSYERQSVQRGLTNYREGDSSGQVLANSPSAWLGVQYNQFYWHIDSPLRRSNAAQEWSKTQSRQCVESEPIPWYHIL